MSGSPPKVRLKLEIVPAAIWCRMPGSLARLGRPALPDVDVLREAKTGMRRINELTGEIVHLGILDEGRIVYFHKIDSQYNLRMYPRIDRRPPL